MKFCLQRLVTVPFQGAALLVLLVSQMFALPLMAAELKNISEIEGCRAIKGEKERLLCYDTVLDGGIFNEEKVEKVKVEEFGSEKMPKPPSEKAAPVAETAITAPAAAPVADTPAAAAPEEPSPAPKISDSGDRLSVTVVRSKKGNYGIHYFQTADGQVWKQVNAQTWTDSAPYDATLKKGILGSFFLVTEGGKSTRVKRVK
ncbi:MAG: hypothetical protein HKP21_11135 [Xanthomonadales bacterium]|nr:hypothetical protein [Gammaproteobacteria bacterium]NNK05103.1 hypothetical protein [Xanthomonadales bacterium]